MKEPKPSQFPPQGKHPDGQVWGGQAWQPTEGPGKRPSLVLLPGFTEDHTLFAGLAPSLAAAGWPVMAVDLPGQGNTPLRQGIVSLADAANWVAQGLETHVPAPWVALGHSMGGYLALALAAQHPERLAGLGLWHSAAHADDADTQLLRKRAQAFIREYGVVVFAQGLIPQYFLPEHQGLSKQAVALAIKQAPATLLAHLEWMRLRPDHTETLRNCPGPVLCLQGTGETRYPHTTLQAEARLNPRTTLSWVPACHMGMYEAPVACAEAILGWLKAHFA